MKQLKKADTWIAVGVLLTLKILAFQKWQTFQASMPDYNHAHSAPQGLAPRPGRSEIGQVVNVVDGATFTVNTEGKQDLIRLCGIHGE